MSTGAIAQGCGGGKNNGNGTGSPAIDVYPTSGLQTTEQAGGQIATFSVVLKSAPTADVTIPISSSDTGEGVVSTASLTFTSTNWAAPQTVTVTGVDDEDQDGDVTYTIILAAATSSDSKYNGVDPADVTVKNIDNDSAGIRTLDTANLTTTEAGGTAKFKVVLNTRPTANVSLGVVSGNTAEVTAAPATLVFTPDNWAAPQEVTLTGVQDEAQDGDIEVTISSGAADSADERYAGKKFDDVKVKNVDDDSAGFLIVPLTGLKTSENGTSDQFTVRLISQPTADVVLPLSSATPGEASIDVQELTFTATNWASPQVVTVTGVDDSAQDGAMPFTIATAPAESADGRYDGRNPPDVTGTNSDNDAPGFTYAGAESIVVNEDGTTDTFTVRLDKKPTGDVHVAVATNKPDQATASPADLVFTPDDWNAPHVVTVAPVDDGTTADGDQDFLVTLAPATSDDADYNGIDPPDVAGIAEDNDSPALRVRYTPPLETTESGGTATVTVYLQTAPTQETVVPVVSSAPGEVSATPANLVFTASSFGPQTITLTGQDDNIVDGNAQATITIGAPTGDPAYAAFPARTLTVTNYDNDTPGIAVTFDDQPRKATREGGGQYRFWVTLRSPPTADVTFSVDTDNHGEGLALTNSVRFTATDWNSPKAILIEGVEDNPPVRDGNQLYRVIFGRTASTDARYNNIQIPPVQLFNDDNDVPGIRVSLLPPGATSLTTTEALGTASFTVSLNTRPSQPVTIPFGTTNAAEGATIASSVTILPDAWNAATAVTVRGADDAIEDGDQPYKITVGPSMSDDTEYRNLTADNINVTNVDDDQAHLVVHWADEPNPLSTLEGEDVNNAIQLRLGTQPQADVTVTVEITVPGEMPQNEIAVDPPVVTFTSANWQADRQFKVTGLPDLAQDGMRPYTIRFVPTSTGDARYNVPALAKTVSGENDDVDSPGIRVRKLVPTSSENGDEAVFSLRLYQNPNTTVDVPLSVVMTTQYDRWEGKFINPADTLGVGGTPTDPTFTGPSSATVQFTAANWSTPQIITIKGQEDALADGDMKYYVRIGPLVSSNPDYAGRNLPNVEFLNQDNDTAALQVGSYSLNSGRLEVTEGATSPTISLRLATRPRGNVVVTFPPTPAGQGAVTPSTLTFTTGNWATPQNFAVAATDDMFADGNVTFDVALAISAASDPEYANLTQTQTIPVRTIDNDSAGIIINDGNPVGTLVVYETGTPADTISGFDVKLAARPAIGTTVKVPVTTSASGDEVTLSSGSIDLTDGIVFDDTNWSQNVHVTLTSVDDTVKDGNVPYTINIGPTTSTDPAWNGTNALSTTVSAQTNDTDTTVVQFTPPLVTGTVNARDFETFETSGGTSQTFYFTLSSQPTSDVALTVTSTDTTEAQVTVPADGIITFTTTDWNTPHAFTIKGQDDNIEDGDQIYEIQFTALTGGDTNFTSQPALISLKGWNRDKDTGRAAVAITPPALTLSLFEDEATSQAFSIALNSEPLGPVTVTATLQNGGGFDQAAATINGANNTNSLVFTTGNWNQAQTLTVAGRSDNDDAGDRNIRVLFTVTSSDAVYNALSLSANNRSGTVYNAPRTCKSALTQWTVTPPASGQTTIDPDLDASTPSIDVYCDHSTGTGGWTLLTWSQNTSTEGGVLYPGQTGATLCTNFSSCAARGIGVPGGAQLTALLQHSTEFGQGQSPGAGVGSPFLDLGAYAYAGAYTYGAGLSTLALSDTYSTGCTQLAAGTFTAINGTFTVANGSAVYVSQGLRSAPAGNDYSMASLPYSWSVGSPAPNCGISSAEPVSVLGTWQAQQYGPRTAAAVGGYAVYVR